jgi:hypothetical protein
MELINERREGFRKVMSEWFTNYSYNPYECYPFENLSKLDKELRYTWGEWGIVYIGIHPFGETLIIEGIWEEEGIRFHININPQNPITSEFRMLIRWWELDINDWAHSIDKN